MEIIKQPPSGGITGPMRVVEGLASQGFAIVPGFLPAALAAALRNEALERESNGEFCRAGIGRDTDHHRNDLIRRDRIRWLNGATLAQCRYRELMEDLRLAINRELFLGLFDLEAHFARYAPGDFYRRHLDAFRADDARVVSTVVYLNPGWHARDGGALRLWTRREARRPVLDVVPRAGTLVSFLSERIPHEVMPARRERTSIAGWFRRNRTTTEWLDPPA